MLRAYNFSAGPSALPTEVLTEVQEELLDFKANKTSVMEISHRGDIFMELATAAEKDLRDILAIPNNYKVLFLQGGASSQFAMVPINLLRGRQTANYVNTGHWSKKAIAEAERFCEVNIASDSISNGYTDIADFDKWIIDENAAYLHYTPNETLSGLEFDYIPEVEMPLAADMSSTILSRPIDVAKFGVIYAGSQKNIAPAGLTIVIVRDDLIGRPIKGQPTLFNYKIHADNNSMYNTPPTFAWYVAGKVFKWIKKKGGLESLAKANKAKAMKLYNAIDNSAFYHNNVNHKYRSWMNISFVLANESLNELFLQKAINRNLLYLKGHKAVGGMRASIYNAMDEKGIDALVDFMKDFEKENT